MYGAGGAGESFQRCFHQQKFLLEIIVPMSKVEHSYCVKKNAILGDKLRTSENCVLSAHANLAENLALSALIHFHNCAKNEAGAHFCLI